MYYVGLIGFMSLFFLFGLYLYNSRKYYDAKETGGVFMVTTIIIICVIGFVWMFSYVDKWDNQRWVESFVQSGLHQKYLSVIEEQSHPEMVDLTPISENLTKWFDNIDRANKYITEYNADNNNFWFDWCTPDWDAPELITFGE